MGSRSGSFAVIKITLVSHIELLNEKMMLLVSVELQQIVTNLSRHERCKVSKIVTLRIETMLSKQEKLRRSLL